MDIKQMRAFVTVADTGNVTRAAQILHLVQPAVSRQIRLLEDDLGTALFVRGADGMSLTDAGNRLLVYARRVLLELDRARAEINGLQADIGGLVTLGLLPSTIDVLAAPLVSALAADYPGVEVRISVGYAGTLLNWLRSGEIDAALLYGSERAADIAVTPLIEEPLWVIAPGDAGLRQGSAVPLARLKGRPLVLPSTPHGIRMLVDHACAVAKIELDISVETNALSVQRSLVLAHRGWTILPPIAVADELLAGRLCGGPLVRPSIARSIVLAMQANRVVPQHVRCAVDLLSECARQAVLEGDWMEARWLPQ